MKDKEMDQLFKDQFENAEIEPSAGLWISIEQQLEIKPVKRKFPFYWLTASAAAVAIIITSLLLTKEEKVQLQVTHSITPLVEKRTPVSVLEKSGTQSPNRIAATIPGLKNKIPVAKVIDTTNLKKDLMVMQPIKEDVRLHDMVERLRPVVNSDTLLLASNQSLGTDEVINESDQIEKRGIRNMGDLINFVVDKLDKREEKLLKFKTDDDDSSLIAINIGFIKFNSKKHK